MRHVHYKLVNVFAETHFGGNPLAVFPDADDLTDCEMQQIATQFNLSETVFVKKSVKTTACLRIFTPSYEMPLAGHPTIGAAAVLHKLNGLPDQFSLTLPAKQVEIAHQNGLFSMEIEGFTATESQAGREFLAELTSLSTRQILGNAYYMNAGVKQLLLQVADANALEQASISREKLSQRIAQDRQDCTADLYLWCEQNGKILSRMFFELGGQMIEDSGTGSAAANLGAYFIHTGKFPCEYPIQQGDFIGRPNRLSLRVDCNQHIFVGGKVVDVGEGIFYLP